MFQERPPGYEKSFRHIFLLFFRLCSCPPLFNYHLHCSKKSISIRLQDQGKYAVFVLPKGKLVQFIRGDLAALLQDMDPGSWPVSQTNRTIQVPALNITLLDQHYKKLETVS